MPIRVDWINGKAKVGRDWVGGLTLTELRLLHRLGQGGTVTRGALLMSAWSGKTVNWNKASRKIDVAVARLRAKLSHTKAVILAVPGEGYRI